jgi:predicted O-methyltransferase YrrM
MNELTTLQYPPAFEAIQQATIEAGFTMASEPLTGALLRTLAASKPNSKFLEIGTGTGIGTCWILDGMDKHSKLISVEREEKVSIIARCYLGSDPRVMFVTADAEEYIKRLQGQHFDFIFADTFPGKFYLLDEVLALLNPGGLYIIDDLLPQPNWPEGHQANVDRLIGELEARDDLHIVKMNWASGLIVATRHS